jgi:hypothetical protein
MSSVIIEFKVKCNVLSFRMVKPGYFRDVFQMTIVSWCQDISSTGKDTCTGEPCLEVSGSGYGF